MNTMSFLMPTIIGIVASLVITVVVIIAVRKMLGTDSKLVQTGEPALATILKIWDTGMKINENPRIGMLLEVRPANRAPYQVEIKKVVSIIQIPQFQPGATLEVRFDPTNPQKVAVTGVGRPMGYGMPR